MDERKLSIGTHAGEAAVRDEVRIGPDDSPEWTDEMFDRADLYEGDRLIRRGRRPDEEETRPERA